MPRLCFLVLLIVIAIAGGNLHAQAQSNDNFAGRLALSGSHPTALSNNLRATSEVGEPNHAGNAAGRSLWWTWTAPVSGAVNFSTFEGGVGTAPPRTLAVYTGTALASLTEAGSSNNLSAYASGKSIQTAQLAAVGASFNLPVTAGTTYQIAVDGTASGSGQSDDGTVALSINSPPTIVSAASVNAAVGTTFQYNILASNDPVGFGASGLPPGLSLNLVSGQITGTPSVKGDFSVSLSATGLGGTGTATLVIQVGDPMPILAAAPTITGAAGANGVVGSSFSYYLYATNNPTSYTVSNLPDGLVLNAINGVITGTPTKAGTFAVGLTATNAVGTGSATLSINVAAAPLRPVITSSLAATATVGKSFAYSIVATGTTPISYGATGLPPGLSLGTGNLISGAPTQQGVYPVTLSASNAGGTRTATVTITVNATTMTTPVTSAPQLSSSAVASGVVNAAFAYTLAATNAPTSFGATGLPSGLMLNAATGAITGTPSASGTFAVPVSASNAYGTSTGTLTFTIFAGADAQTAANGVIMPVVTSAASAGGYTGQALSYLLTATYAGSGPLYPSGAWTFSASGLPPGLSLSSTTSSYGSTTITGTPTQEGVYPVTVTAAVPASTVFPTRQAATTTAVVMMTVKAGPAAVPAFSIHASYSLYALISSFFNEPVGATNNPTSYATSGLPPGLSVNPTTGLLSGTCTAVGTYKATLSATNKAGTGSAVLTFYVAPEPPPLINSAAAAYGTLGTAFNYTINSSFVFNSCSASGLPPGLSCNPSTGVISGKPTAAGVYRVPFTLTRDTYVPSSGTLTITIAPVDVPATIVNSGVEALGTVGSAFSYKVDASPVATGYTAGTLPAGLVFNPSTGVISGTPTVAGIYTIPLSATSASGTGSGTLTVVVAPLPAPVFSSGGIVNTTPGTSFSYALAATNSPTGYTAGNLPAGLSFNPSTGTLSGSVATAGVYRIPVSATNSGGTCGATLTINVVASGNSALPTFQPGAPLVYIQVESDGGALVLDCTGNPTSYTATGLPAGWLITQFTTNSAYLGANGGTSAVGTYSATITATNSAGSTTTVITFTITPYLTAPPFFSSPPVETLGDVNVPFGVGGGSYSFSATGNTTSYAASGLPPGLTFSYNAATATVSGTPTAVGVYPVTLSATNAVGTVTVVWTVVVKDGTELRPQFTGPSTSTSAAVGIASNINTVRVTTLLPSGTTVYPSLTFSFSGLPPGLSGAATSRTNAALTGTPAAAGTYPVTITATTSAGVSISEILTIEVRPVNTPAIASAASVSGNSGVALSYGISGYDTVLGYSADSLPPGLALNTSTGVISGTPTAAGTYAATVSLTTVAGTGAAVVTFNIDGPIFGGLPLINSAAVASCQDVVSGGLSGGNETVAFAYAITATSAPTSFGASNLPAGLSLNPYTGIISGRPVNAGVFQVPITATNAAGTSSAVLTILANATVPVLVAPLGASGIVGNPLTGQVNATAATSSASYYQAYGFLYDPLTFSCGGLPPGLSLNITSGVITGTPTQNGIYPVVVSAANRAGRANAVTTITVAATAPAPTSAPVFSGQATATGFVGLPLTCTLTASAGASYTATGLPDGLSLNAATGVITGAPAQAGTFSVPVMAANSVGTTQAVLTLSVDPVPSIPAVGSAAGANSTVGTPFLYSIYATAVSGMPAATAYGASSLPAGLSVNTQNGFITGTPAGPSGTFLVPVSVSTGTVTGSGMLTLVIQAAPASLSVPALADPAGALGFADGSFSYSLAGTGFAPVSTLPAGLSFDPATNAISGFPGEAGSYQIPLTAPMDADHTSAAVLTLTVLNPNFSLPRVTTEPTGRTVVQNDTTTFSVGATGVPPPQLQWLHNGASIPGATSATLTLSSVQPADMGVYTVVLTNAAGRVVSTPANLLVQQTYATWQAAHFTAAQIAGGQATDGVDLSGDGVPNLLKYAEGIDPITGTGGSVPTSTYSPSDHRLQFVFSRDSAKTDINYLVEASSDLSQWTTIASSTTGAATINLGGATTIVERAIPGTSQIQVVIANGSPVDTINRSFVRLRVIRPN